LENRESADQHDHGIVALKHLARVAMWYAANGWLYSYHYVADNAIVSGGASQR
jgi:hypothetical protein